METFHEVRLPEDIERGAQGGPEFLTSILELSNGQEQRNINWSRAKASYDIAYGITEKDNGVDSFQTVLQFFYARRGRAIGFRFKDWLDYQATGVTLSAITGFPLKFQLVKTYVSGGFTFTRKITRPVSGTVQIFENGVPSIHATTDVTTGIVTFSTTAVTPVTATFEFDVPVRFDTDKLSIRAETFRAGTIPSIVVREIIE